LLSEYKIGAQRPLLIVIPPQVWHGVQNYSSDTAVLLNAVDYAYKYDDPDHWRVPLDSSDIPYSFPV
jgi:dTDP-4-dehydrorhamnose 3,5-epimerase